LLDPLGLDRRTKPIEGVSIEYWLGLMAHAIALLVAIAAS
jgi:hypothetical protein